MGRALQLQRLADPGTIRGDDRRVRDQYWEVVGRNWNRAHRRAALALRRPDNPMDACPSPKHPPPSELSENEDPPVRLPPR